MNAVGQTRHRARQLLENGQAGQAVALLEPSVKDSPKDIDSIYLLGICYLQSGNFTTAEKYLGKAVKLNKQLFQAYTDLGVSQAHQRKFSEASKSFRKALAINQTFAPAHSHLALAYLQTQELRKALKHAKKSVALDSGNPNYLNVEALCYRSLNQAGKAIDAFKAIISAYPTFYRAYQNLYETYRVTGDKARAENVLRNAIEVFKDDVNVYIALGHFYEQNDRTGDAKALYEEALQRCPDHPVLLVALGRVNRLLGYFDDGVALIEQALSSGSDNQAALVERCSFHILKGEYDEAYALLGRFMACEPRPSLTPGLSIAYAHVCRLTGRHEDSINILRKTLEKKDLPDDMKSVILFSIADSHDKMQQYARAFSGYSKANTVAAQKSDIDRHLKTLSDIHSAIGSDVQGGAIRSDNNSEKPVFIVGMPRSGTSLVEQIIASHPEAYGAGEITELWRIAQDISDSKTLANYTERLARLRQENLNEYADRYLSFVENLAPNAVRITDKLPHNFMHIGLIKQLFPEARIIHCHRHPFDTCLSIYFKRFNDSHLYARDLREIAKFYAQYWQLMKRWDCTDTNLYSLKYEDLVTNPEHTTRAIIDYVGLNWDDQCLRHHESARLVTTLSYTQVNKPIYTGSINRWKNYERHIQPLIDVLGEPERYDQGHEM